MRVFVCVCVCVCDREIEIKWRDIVERLGALALRAAAVCVCVAMQYSRSATGWHGSVWTFLQGRSYGGPPFPQLYQRKLRYANNSLCVFLEWCLCVETLSTVSYLRCKISVLCTKISNPWRTSTKTSATSMWPSPFWSSLGDQRVPLWGKKGGIVPIRSGKRATTGLNGISWE